MESPPLARISEWVDPSDLSSVRSDVAIDLLPS
jgi:hypothetical protein